MAGPVSETVCETMAGSRAPDYTGKVRDVYDLGDRLVIVATDRISAFDWINPVGIPGKGKILTQLSLFWFDQVRDLIPNHLISADLSDFPPEFQAQPEMFRERSMLVHKCEMFPIEVVIRGYLAGSGWKEYRERGTVCGIPLPPGLVEADKLPEPLYTPATKAASGHDENIHPDRAGEIIGHELNARVAEVAKALYLRASGVAAERGILLCDTKFEFGFHGAQLTLADEILTPDSSRYWPASGYEPGRSQASYDKQYVRDYLEGVGWDKQSPQPPLPEEVVSQTLRRYADAYEHLTGRSVP